MIRGRLPTTEVDGNTETEFVNCQRIGNMSMQPINMES